MSEVRKTIQLVDKCEWRQRYEDGLFKWHIQCNNTVWSRQSYDEDRGTCGFCGRPIYFAVRP